MAKRKAAKNAPVESKSTSESVEPVLIALAEQLGTFLGRAQKKADVLLADEAVQQQMSQIRAGATQLLERVNRASAEARKSAAKMASTVKSSVMSAKKAASEAPPPPKPRSGGTVDAPGKKHRKPPPQEKFDRGMTQSKSMLMGQKGIKGRMQRGGSSQ